MAATAAAAPPPPFVQPKPWLRWASVILAVAGWYVAFQSFRISAGADVKDPLMQALCGGAAEERGLGGCTSVLTSPQAYWGSAAGPKIPVSTLGMGYFAFVGLWYLFVGPPTRTGRSWHALIAVVVLCGVWQSLVYIGVMAYELHRWCGSCLTAHAINGGLLILTLLAWPRRKPAEATAPHPATRLALATATAGLFVFVTHLAFVYVNIAGSILRERTEQFAQVLDDPAYVLWDFNRQPSAALPLLEDEVFAGAPTAPNTVVLFSDFQCTHCKTLHEVLAEVMARHPGQLRIALRHHPQDPECNAAPQFRAGAHASACRAARAAEAVRRIADAETYLRMQALLFERQSQFPTTPYAQQTEQQRELFADWASGLGLDRAAFVEAMDSPAVAARIQADIELAGRLEIQALPVAYLNGKRLRGWRKPEIWDVLLGGEPAQATQPASIPVAP